MNTCVTAARRVNTSPTNLFVVRLALVAVVGLVSLLAPHTAKANYTATLSGSTVTFTGNGASEVLRLGQFGNLLTHSAYAKGAAGFVSATDLDSSQGGIQSLSLSKIQTIVINGGEGDDTLVIENPAGGVFAPNAVILYNGQGGQHDALVIQGGGGANFAQVYQPGPGKDEGIIAMSDSVVTQVIHFTGLEPVVDTVPAASFIVNGTDADNAINYKQGTVPANGLVSVDNFETIEFSNKTNLTINGLAGGDTINLNNPSTPTGLTGITVNGGDPTGGSDTLIVNGLPGVNDNFFANPTGQGSGTITKITGAQPTVTFTGMEHLNVVGQATESDTFHYTGTTGTDTHEYTPGSTTDSGTVTGFSFPGFPFVPATFRGINGFTFLGSGESVGVAGGTDTLIVNGTEADDIFGLDNPLVFGSASLSLTAAGVARPRILFDGDRGVTTLVHRRWLLVDRDGHGEQRYF